MKSSYFLKRPMASMPRIPLLLCFAVVFLAPPTSQASTDLRAFALNPSLLSTGLKNLGNTCYMNAQLECAFHIPLLRQLVIDPVEPQPVDSSNENDDEESSSGEADVVVETSKVRDESDAKIALRELFTDMIAASSQQLPAVTPRNFCLRLGIPPMVQQDSQEFWKLLLPALEQESISDLYKGSFEAYITALDGSGRERRREELFLDLSLDIDKSSTLLDSLKETFGEPELLSVKEGNGWRPEKGADKVDAHKGSSLIANGLPPILQFHLKRFSYDYATDTMTKVNSRLEFPSEIDLGAICKPVNGKDGTAQTIYDLQSVVIHAGKYGAGHYYAYVRPDVRTDTWYRFNDHIVERVPVEEVFQDSYGGKGKVDRHPASKKGGRGLPSLGRLFKRFAGVGGNSYGYGGQTSNAYVVQYVRRSDLSRLYLD